MPFPSRPLQPPIAGFEPVEDLELSYSWFSDIGDGSPVREGVASIMWELFTVKDDASEPEVSLKVHILSP